MTMDISVGTIFFLYFTHYLSWLDSDIDRISSKLYGSPLDLSPAGPREDFLNGLIFFGDTLAGLGGARNDLNIIFINKFKQC